MSRQRSTSSNSSNIPSHLITSLGLQGRLLEVAVVVGMDEDTGLIQRSLEHTEISENDSLFQMHFQPKLLDIISGTQETSQSASMTIQGTNATDPQDWRKSLRQIKSAKVKRPPSKGVSRARSVRKLRMKANVNEEVPVSTDFLSNLPLICMPDNSKVYTKEQPPHTHFVVLTDISGTRHYAAVLTIYMQFNATKTSDLKSWKLSHGSNTLTRVNENGNSETLTCFVPQCICFVSHKPYFDVLKNALSCLNKDLKGTYSQDLFRKTLEKYVTNLSVILCPPPTLNINFHLGSWPFTIFSSKEAGKPDFITGLDLRLPLFVFMRQPETLLQVLACILLEQRLVFISENYSLITLVMEALLYYLRPFLWPHQYVPLLFSEIIDFVACPGIFLMGCHSMHKEKIEQVDNDQIIVDLDTGKVITCASYEWRTDIGDKAITKGLDQKPDCHFPNLLTDKVLYRLSELDIYNTVSSLSKPTPVTVEDNHKASMEMQTKNNRNIQYVFMEMMVDLFGNTIFYLDHELNQFRADEFMETVNSEDLPFYLKVVKTYMFKRFVNERLKRTQDTFAKLAEAVKKRSGAFGISTRRTFGKIRSAGDTVLSPVPNSKKSSTLRPVSAVFADRRTSVKLNGKQNGSFHGKNNLVSKPFALRKVSDSSIKDSEFDKFDAVHSSLNLPTFPVQGTNFNVGHFYKRCVELVTDLLSKTTNSPSSGTDHTPDKPLDFSVSTNRAACLLVRGLYLIAMGNNIKGLEDLHETAKEDYRMFPERIIKTIVSMLSPRDLQSLRSQNFYKGDDFYKMQETKQRNESFYYSDNELPYNPLEKSELSLILEKSDVASNSKVIDRIFAALSGSQNEVDPETFASFYHTWKQTRHECEIALRSLLSASNTSYGLLQDSEKLLKVSSVVSSEKGTGRLILTTRKLLFMTDLYQQCKLMIRLNQITRVKLSKQKNFFRHSPSLSIKYGSDGTFKVAIKSNELWMNLIREMQTGRMLSRDWKDHAMTLASAAQNVGIADAIYQSAKDDGYMTMETAMEWVEKFCDFTKQHESGQLRAVPLKTDEMLVLRIDIAPKESKKTNITNIMFSPAGIDEIPRVWVALASNKIRLIDTTQWKLDSRPIKDCNSKLLAMHMVSNGELWVGGADKNIYAIRTETMKKTRILHEHTGPVVSIFACCGQIVSATSSGEVVIWNQELTKPHKTFQVVKPPFSLISAQLAFNNLICCCTKESLSLYSLEGELLQKLICSEFFESHLIESHITCCFCSEDNEIYAGDSNGSVFVWHRRGILNAEVPGSKPIIGERFNRVIPKCTGLIYGINDQISVTCLLKAEHNIWVGNNVGDIAIVHSDTLCQDRVLKAHDDAVSSLCLVENRYVISGSCSKDGKIAVWRALSHQHILES